MAVGAVARLRFQEVGGFAVDVEDHVASCVADGCVWVGGGVVQDPEDFVICVVCGFGLLGGNGSKCNQHCQIGGDGIIQKCSDDLLEQVY